MKNIITLTITIFALLSCKAQSMIVPLTQCPKTYDHTNPNYYLKDTTNEMDKFAGTWKWTNGNKEFQLTLIKQKHLFNQTGNDNYYKDRLVGYYKYWENGMLIADTSAENLNEDYRIKVFFTLDCYSHITSIAFEDYKKYKGFEVMLEKISPTQMKMKMRGEEHIVQVRNGVQSPPNEPQTGSTFPMEMILTKQ